MPTGLDVVRKALWTINTYHPTYNSWIGELRCHPDRPPHVCDCSGLWCFVMSSLGIGMGCVNSAYFAQIGHQRGLGVDIEFAKTHAGYFLIRGPNQGQNGYGNLGHVGVGLGLNRRSIEARGTYAGVGVFGADEINWSYAMKIPGVSYNVTTQPPPDVKPKAPPKEDCVVFWLPGQANSNFRPIGLSVVNGSIFLWNVTKNPFREGTIGTWPNAHVLHLPLAAGEEVLGATDRRPDGSQCPPNQPIEIVTNLPNQPNGKGQPRHVLTRV